MMYLIAFVMMFQVATDTPTPEPTPEATNADAAEIQDEAAEAAATAQALQENPFLVPDPDNRQIYDSTGAPILPEFTTIAIVFSYAKILFDAQTGQSIFGPFYPILAHLRSYLIITLLWLQFYYLTKLIIVVVKFALFLVRYIIPFLG
jgi:hypothetical protein